MINFQIYKTHIKPIKPQKPALIKPVKPAGLGFMIKPGFYANPELEPNEINFTELSLTADLQSWTPIFGAGTPTFWRRLHSFVWGDSHFLEKRAQGLLFSKS